LKKIKVPVLGMHAVDDPVVPYKLGKKANDALETRKWWWRVKGGGHSEAFHIQRGNVRTRFLEFLDQL